MIATLAEFAAACGGALIGEDHAYGEVLIDSRQLAPGDLFAALRGTRLDGHQFVAEAQGRGAAGALVQRALPLALPQIRVDSVEAALASAAQRARAQFTGSVIGVAGSNGKTTVKEMIASILSQRGPCLSTRGNLNNQLGVPLTLLRLRPVHRSAVIEIGANRAGEVAQLLQWARPGVGLITNAGAEHLEGFGSLEGVARAEGEMVAGLAADATAIINADDPFASLWQESTRARVLRFGFAPEAQFRAHTLRLQAGAHGFLSHFTLVSPMGEAQITLSLAGRHNVVNALAAAAAASSAGATLADVVQGLALVRAVKGRLQLKRTRCAGLLIDDSYNANPSSLQAALEVLCELPARRWLVLGEMAELGEFAEQSHREAGELARALGVERLYAFGPLAGLAAGSFGEGAERFDQLPALALALEGALQPDVALLIKGSRLNRLERLVAALEADSDSAHVPAPQVG